MTSIAIRRRPSRRSALLAVVPLLVLSRHAAGVAPEVGQDAVRVAPALRLVDDAARDQDDMCVWVHPTDSAKSRIITSDKSADRIFVYDLDGRTVQTMRVKHPGNVDIRYGVPLAGRSVDIIAVNQRSDTPQVVVFSVEPASGRLTRIDDGSITTAESTGGTLYRSPVTRAVYFLVTSEDSGLAEQFELVGTPEGRMTGKKVRSWRIQPSEAAVGDDEHGRIYISDEAAGVWAVGGEPSDPTPGKLVIEVGRDGLVPDVEGLTIYKHSATDGYLIVSNQSRSQFNVYTRQPPYRFVGAFGVEGARNTDGIDVVNVALGSRFPRGLFACHTDLSVGKKRPVLLTPFEGLAEVAGLKVDTTWEPRTRDGSRAPAGSRGPPKR